MKGRIVLTLAGVFILLTAAFSRHPKLLASEEDSPELNYRPGRWVEIGGSATGGGISAGPLDASYPSLALDSKDYPVVAWSNDTECEFKDEIYARRWDGSAWVEIGEGSASGGGISNSEDLFAHGKIAVDLSDMPVVAWHDQSNVFVRKWDGKAWVKLGDESKNEGVLGYDGVGAEELSLALDPQGSPVIAWSSGCNGCPGEREIYVRRWDGSRWVDVGEGSGKLGGITRNPGASMGPSVAVDDMGRPIVAWNDSSHDNVEIYVKQWDGRKWAQLGRHSAKKDGISDNCTFSVEPSIAFDPTGLPVVAWSDGNVFFEEFEVECGKTARESAEIYVRRWDGKRWIEVGEGSASGTGISNTPDESWDAVVRVDEEGLPIVAWYDGGSVFVRKYNGSEWVELGQGSASGKGISGEEHGGDPAMALDSNGNPVIAWTASCNSTEYIYLKKFVPERQ